MADKAKLPLTSMDVTDVLKTNTVLEARTREIIFEAI